MGWASDIPFDAPLSGAKSFTSTIHDGACVISSHHSHERLPPHQLEESYFVEGDHRRNGLTQDTDPPLRVLDKQGAPPLRAIVDFDEAWMEVRYGKACDRERALALLDAARGLFEQIGMPGWLRRAEELRRRLER